MKAAKAVIRSCSLFCLAAFGTTLAATTLAWSQDAPPVFNTPIQHVIVVIQENRTPDNLFGSAVPNNLLPGADLASSGQCKSQNPTTIPLQPGPLQTCVDPNHSHTGGFDFLYDKGNMDDACDSTLAPGPSGCPTTVTCQYSNGAYYPCQYQYVQNNIPGGSKPNGTLDPYFNIAKNYGYANYMFQTNQGPSFPAHQFLFSGTSAPVKYPIDLTTGSYKWFDTENVYGPLAGTKQNDPYFHGQSGCLAPTWDPNGNVTTIELDPTPTQYKIFPCYDHLTMADLIENSGYTTPLTWRWYGNTGNDINDPQSALKSESSLWNAPNAISHICDPVQTQGTGTSEFATCNGLDWSVQTGHNAANVSMYIGQLFNDLGDNATGACNLANVSWVIPDGHWSDHPGNDPTSIVDGGPSWVAAIINAVGGYTNSKTSINPAGTKPCGYWSNTVVIVVWDDWGGWYDHVLPWNCTPGPDGACDGYSNGSGKQYVYGFRVPMLVVSAYMTKAGYISGSTLGQSKTPPYVHDFGSILNFIEYVFGTGGNFLGGTTGIGYLNDPYADALAPDGPDVLCGTKPCPFGLSDFFNFNQASQPFTFIQGTNYITDCFIHPQNHKSTCFGSFAAMDPDNDATAP